MSTDTISPLRQRMIEDMNTRKLCAGTLSGHVRICRKFAEFLERSPDTYAPVAKLVSYPHVLMVKAAAPWTTMREFLSHVRAHPGQVSVGVPGFATVAHLNVGSLGSNSVRTTIYFGPSSQY